MNGSLVCYSCHKTSHLRKDCRTREPAPRNEQKKGEKTIDQIKNQMNPTWRKKEEERNSRTSEPEITQSNGSSNHTTSN